MNHLASPSSTRNGYLDVFTATGGQICRKIFSGQKKTGSSAETNNPAFQNRLNQLS
jgi:hypothetical protein